MKKALAFAWKYKKTAAFVVSVAAGAVADGATGWGAVKAVLAALGVK